MQKLRSMIYRPSEQNMPLFPKFMEFGFGGGEGGAEDLNAE